MATASNLRSAAAVLAVAAPLWGLGVGPARAQMDSREAIALQNQILELRRDLQIVAQGRGGVPAPVPRGGPPPSGDSDLAAQLLDRVATLENEVRRLRGQADEQANQSRRQFDDLSKQIADMQFRLQQGGGASQPQSPAPGNLGSPGASIPTPPVGPVRRTPELAMQEGNAALARRDYPAAEAAAREVLAAGRSTPRSADAQFLLAQSLAGRRDNQAAAIAYDDAYRANRQGSRAPDSLLGLANSLIAINEKQAACTTLDKLRTEFPSPRGDIRESVAAARGRAGCR